MTQLVKIILIFQIVICNNFVMASDCREPITLIEKGTPTPCTGFLYSPYADAQAEADHRDLKYYKLINERLTERQELMQKQSQILDKRLKLYMDQSHSLSQELQQKESRSEWSKIGWFFLGIGLTGVAVYGAGQLNN